MEQTHAAPAAAAQPAARATTATVAASATPPPPATRTFAAAPRADAIPAAAAIAALLLAFAAVPAARAQLVVSEAMADPAALPDARGEFVELANAGDGREAAPAAWLVVDGDSLALGPVDLGAGEYLLLCRDSAALAAAGAPCGRGLPGLSLANGRLIRMAVAWRDLRSDFEVPASVPGVSRENTFDDDGGLRAFAASGRPFLDGDSATPGYRNSRSLRPAAHDLSIRGAALRDGGVLDVDVVELGSRPSGAGLTVRLDRDWDGTAETPVDSAAVGPGGGGLRFALEPDHLGVLHIALDGDEDPAGNAARLLRLEGGTLRISEVCPAPEAGPEWAEIRNVTGSAEAGPGGGAAGGGGVPAGYARSFELSRVAWDGRPLGPGAGRLGPGEYALLTADAAGLRAALGPLKARILEVPGWAGLRNSGDTCRLALEGRVLDSLVYGARAAGASPCLVRGPPGAPGSLSDSAVPGGAPTPGYAGSAPSAPRLSVSPRVLAPGGELAVDVEAPPGATFGLRVFDLEGNLIRVLARGGGGRHALAWAGGDGSGRLLPPGPYVLGLSVPGRAPVRKVVVVGGGR